MDREAWGRLFPLPFVAVAVLLVVLILLTPNLLVAGGPSAGSLATQAELTIDRPGGGNVTHFYVNGLGTVRYTEIRAMVCTNVPWPAPSSVANLTWWNATWGSQVLAAQFSSSANPIALNVTALYIDPEGSGIEFYAVYELYFTATTLEGTPLVPGLAVLPPTPLTSLPTTILLASGPPGSAP